MTRWLAAVALLAGGACGGDGAGSPPDAQAVVVDAGPPDAARHDAAAPPGACEAFVESEDTPLAVPDEGTAESVIILGAVAADVVQTVVVQVNIAHPYPRDLDLTLISPAGSEVILAEDQAAAYLGTRFTATGLAGETASGAWTLRVVDDAAGQTGTLAGWSIRIDACTPPTCVVSTLHLEQHSGPGSASLQTFYTVSAPDLNVAAARAAFWVYYPFDEDLELSLFSPAGRKVLCSDGNGSSGDNYEETVFDDRAGESIVDAQSPFTGSFRPEQPLAALAGAPASGAWLLGVVNHHPGDDSVPADPLAFEGSWLELDLCELSCPEGTRALRYTSGAGEITVDDPGSLVAAAVVVSASGGADASLRSPSGTAVHLGASPEGFQSTLFADDAARALAEGAPPYEGRFRPLEALGALAGEAGAGSWTLDAGAGTLEGWALDLCVR